MSLQNGTRSTSSPGRFSLPKPAKKRPGDEMRREIETPFPENVIVTLHEMSTYNKTINATRFSCRQGWYVRTDFVDNMWTVNRQTVDHWRALQLPIVLQQLSVPSDLFACGDCVEQEFHPKQCLNQSSGNCAALLGDNRGNGHYLLFLLN